MSDMQSPRRKPTSGGKDKTVAEIERLAKQRENRRKSAEIVKKKREIEIKDNERKGRPGDVDFQRMIRRFRRDDMNTAMPHDRTGPLKINVVVRKRPVSEQEVLRKDYDSVSCSNPIVHVHHCKLKVDGITKFLDNTTFQVDHAFHESAPNEEVYIHTAKHLVDFAVNGGRATCFAYGQTGSGKTFTMAGIQASAARDVFDLIEAPEHSDKQLEVYCSFFELYGGRCIDLLHSRTVCAVREDGKGRVQVEGLKEMAVCDEDELLRLIEQGNNARTTHATEMNNDSSRSHAICQIALRKMGAREGAEPYGKLSLTDLAGSERGQDTKHHNRQRRQESAEINKSLLALKECIRALEGGPKNHVPYRGSKLTMVLKDSFSADSKTVMISCVSPAASSSDHTLNTLRYADRVKQKTVGHVVPYIADNRQPNEEYLSSEEEEEELDCSPPPPPESPMIRNTPLKRIPVLEEKTPVTKLQQPRRRQWDTPSQIRTPLQSNLRDNVPRGAAAAAPKSTPVPKPVIHSSNFDEVVRALVDEEEQLLSLHMKTIQRNADILTQEGELLSKVEGGDDVDYDIDEYASHLEKLLGEKLGMMQDLQDKVKMFRRHLALEGQ